MHRPHFAPWVKADTGYERLPRCKRFSWRLCVQVRGGNISDEKESDEECGVC